MDEKTWKKYDTVVETVVRNVLAERNRTHKIILWNFSPYRAADRLYFHVASVVGDIYDEPIYLDLSIFKWWKFKNNPLFSKKIFERLGWKEKRQYGDDLKTPVATIMEYVREYHQLDGDEFQKIVDEFYEVRKNENNNG